MHSKLYTSSSMIVAAISMAAAQAVIIPVPGGVYQIQPTFRGSFPRTPCLTVVSAANNSALVIQDCSYGTQQRGFSVDNGGSTTGAGPIGPISVFGNFCLEPVGDANADGTKIEINSCTAQKASQQWQWNSDGTVNLAGTDKCLDLTDGVLNNGNQLQIWTCTANNQNQIWSANPLNQPLNEVAPGSNGNVCIGADSSANGAPVFATPCSDTTAHKVWKVPQMGHGNTGSYQLAFGPDGTGPVKCLDVTDGQAVAGTKLQLWDCNDSGNQYFLPFGSIKWTGTSSFAPYCVDLTDGVTTRGNQIQIWNCISGNSNQIWDHIAPLQTAT